MYTEEDLRKNIVESVFPTPLFGENYIDWHSDNGECGLTLIIGDDYFDITINKRIIEEETN